MRRSDGRALERPPARQARGSSTRTRRGAPQARGQTRRPCRLRRSQFRALTPLRIPRCFLVKPPATSCAGPSRPTPNPCRAAAAAGPICMLLTPSRASSLMGPISNGRSAAFLNLCSHVCWHPASDRRTRTATTCNCFVTVQPVARTCSRQLLYRCNFWHNQASRSSTKGGMEEGNLLCARNRAAGHRMCVKWLPPCRHPFRRRRRRRRRLRPG